MNIKIKLNNISHGFKFYRYNNYTENPLHPAFKRIEASLFSKAQSLGCVFDTPDGDALPIIYGGTL